MVPLPSPSDLRLGCPLPLQLCRAARWPSVAQEAEVAEALEVTAAAAAAAGATEAAAPPGALSRAAWATERAVEVVMGAAAVGAASTRAEAAGVLPACRSSKLLLTPPTLESWSRSGSLLSPFLRPSDPLSLTFSQWVSAVLSIKSTLDGEVGLSMESTGWQPEHSQSHSQVRFHPAGPAPVPGDAQGPV